MYCLELRQSKVRKSVPIYVTIFMCSLRGGLWKSGRQKGQGPLKGQGLGLKVRTRLPLEIKINGEHQGSRGQGRVPEVDEPHWVKWGTSTRYHLLFYIKFLVLVTLFIYNYQIYFIILF